MIGFFSRDKIDLCGQTSDMHRMFMCNMLFYLCLGLIERDIQFQNRSACQSTSICLAQTTYTHARARMRCVLNIQHGIRISNKLVSKIIFHLAKPELATICFAARGTIQFGVDFMWPVAELGGILFQCDWFLWIMLLLCFFSFSA